jgi:signal transduction histidine kinase
MTGRAWSLQRRLLVTIGAATLLSWGISSVWIYQTAVRESDQMLDAALDHTAHAVLAVVRNEASELNESGGGLGTELAEIDQSDQTGVVYQILGPNGLLVFRSHGAPTALLAGPHDRGFNTTHIDGTDYRVYTLAAELDVAAIHVAQPLIRRAQSAQANAAHVLVPAAALMLALMAAVAWSVRKALDPVVRYADALGALAPDRVEPLDTSRLPLELQPVSRSVDGLLLRVRDALLRERTLTADAAHEMRTPLAALRLQAQVARRAAGAAERDGALVELMSGADRAARMIDSVLALARLDAGGQGLLKRQEVRLGPLAGLVAAEFSATAEMRGIALALEADGGTVLGDEDALAVALRNLLANAMRYARERITIRLEVQDGWASIRVSDDGPGFKEEDARRAFHRFFRGAERAQSDGVGLGLSLVLQIAKVHGGSASIVPQVGGGATVEIRLPTAGAFSSAGGPGGA